MLKKLGIGFATWVTAASGLLIGKSSNSNDLVFGNYSDYISSDVAQELREKYQLRVDLFDYDHLVKERFQKGIYDIAITSTSVLFELKSSNAVLKLDWSKLLGKSNEQTQNSESKTVEDARKLFTEIVRDMSHDLLEYGIPYFVQKLSFYYTGKPIEALGKGKKVKFKDLVEIVSSDSRFHSKNGKAQLGLIDDPRTVLSLARKVVGKQDVNPKEHEYRTSQEILSDYRYLIDSGLNKDRMGENFLYMTPDSGPMVDALSGGDIKGAFMYNGDGLFASAGGNAKKKIKDGEFHTVELAENIFFLDFLTFSSKMSKEKQEKAYEMAKKLLFISDENKDDPFKEDENEKYVEMMARNFDDVWYTPTLDSVYRKLEKYFEDEDEDAKGLVKGKTKHEIIKVEKTEGGNLEHDYEKQLSSQKKSDMLIAYSNFKLLV
ncbi:spermidine/putrescine ABC transporter substrate-binding protein [Candidatus Mycoplasma haematobovis]|uniref:Spermidine/putrescine ABC transporter substrate-binding protein n=1 Tax=Candidatus Mycoplasma haematobovis TaxID=432608 RepID=A0A1A9QCP0_9MOLU|nr:spermidine/putrescine ABC transporter substrate-binding protein [Candidatus Mycoplasma haematobovis]OAL10237.1 spermidine/putrescine ABC transporter substrate-binding protein [Candidatus Mycoplasma haematobovis]